MIDEVNVMDRLLSAILCGDLEAVRNCFTADGAVWHGYDCVAHDLDSFVASIANLSSSGAELQYEDIRRHETPTGFVQQHLLVTRNPEGGFFGKPCCVVVTLKDGRIHHAAEYLDRTGTITLSSIPRATPGLN